MIISPSGALSGISTCAWINSVSFDFWHVQLCEVYPLHWRRQVMTGSHVWRILENHTVLSGRRWNSRENKRQSPFSAFSLELLLTRCSGLKKTTLLFLIGLQNEHSSLWRPPRNTSNCCNPLWYWVATNCARLGLWYSSCSTTIGQMTHIRMGCPYPAT